MMNLSDLQDSYPLYLEEDELESFDEADLNKQFEDLALDDEEEKPDPAMIREISLLCVKDYNSAKGKNLEFVRVKQAERFQACGGYIYCLALIVQNDRREVSEIEKMVWQGELMEVLHAENKSISIEQKQGNVNLLEVEEVEEGIGHRFGFIIL